MSDIDRIIAGLSEAQRRVLKELPDDGTFADAYSLSRHRSVRIALNRAGLTEPERVDFVTSWWSVRPTTLGQRVRARLLEREGGE